MENNSTTNTREALLKDLDLLKKNASQVVQDVKDHANARVTETRQHVTGAIGQAREKTRAHPLAILSVGLVIGFILGRRR